MSAIPFITTQGKGDTTAWVVYLKVSIPADNNDVWLSLVPLYEVLQRNLREPCHILPRTQTTHYAIDLGQQPLGAFDPICSVGELAYAL